MRLEVTRNHEHAWNRALRVARPAAAQLAEALFVQAAPTPVAAMDASIRALAVDGLQYLAAEVALVAFVQSHVRIAFN